MSRPNPNEIRRNAKRARLIRDWRALAAKTHDRIADSQRNASGSDDAPSDELNRFSMDQEET